MDPTATTGTAKPQSNQPNQANQPNQQLNQVQLDIIKHDAFSKHLKELFKQLLAILDSLHGTRIRTGAPPIEFTYLNNYMRITGKLLPQEILKDFELTFARNRQAILSYPKTGWLTNEAVPVVIQLGEATMKTIPEKVLEVRILLSSIFRMALELRDSVLQGNPEATSADPDLVYHEQVLLQLYRIFYAIAQSTDSPRLYPIVSTLEEKLKVPNEERTPFQRSGPPSQIFSFVGDLVERVIPLPKGLRERFPTDDETKDTFDRVINHPTTQAFMGGVFGPVKDQLQTGGSINVPQAFSTVIENIQKPEMQAQMKGMLIQTIETSRNHGVSEEQVERMKQQAETAIQSMPAGTDLIRALTTLPQHLNNTMSQTQANPAAPPVIYDE